MQSTPILKAKKKDQFYAMTKKYEKQTQGSLVEPLREVLASVNIMYSRDRCTYIESELVIGWIDYQGVLAIMAPPARGTFYQASGF